MNIKSHVEYNQYTGSYSFITRNSLFVKDPEDYIMDQPKIVRKYKKDSGFNCRPRKNRFLKKLYRDIFPDWV